MSIASRKEHLAVLQLPNDIHVLFAIIFIEGENTKGLSD